MLSRSQSARIAGLASWEQARPEKLLASSRGGATVVKRYGRSHMLRLALRRQQYGCAGGTIPPKSQDDRGGLCPACGKKVSVTSRNQTRRHVRLGAPPVMAITKRPEGR